MADRKYEEAKLSELKKEYSKTKHNKATNKHLGILRAKIANIKREMESHSRRSGTGYSVRKSGNATVVLVGFPNAGKSSLLKALTGVDSKVADYAFTTLDVIPGMLEYSGAKIQILDLPGLIQGAHLGKGGSMKIASVIRIADFMLFVVDINSYQQVFQLADEIGLLNIRINRKRPRIRIEKGRIGGMNIEPNGHSVPTKDVIINILNEFKIFSGEIIFYEDTTEDMLIDFVADNCVYMKGAVALNKIDTAEDRKVEFVAREIKARTRMDVIPISAKTTSNIEDLKGSIFTALKLVRVYLKPKDGAPDFENPLVLDSGSTIVDVVRKINSKLISDTKYAYVSGPSARFSNQKVGVDHTLMDGDIVTLVFS